MQAENQPLPDEAEKATTPLDASQRGRMGSGASILKFLKNNILKPRPQHTEIHSGSIAEGEQDKTLAPFTMSGVSVGRVNRDYEAFLTPSAWGGQPVKKPPEAVTPSSGATSNSTQSVSPQNGRSEPSAGGGNTKAERALNLALPTVKPRSRTSGDVISEGKGEGQQQQQKGGQQFGGHSPLVPRSHALGQQGPPQPPQKRSHYPPNPPQKTEVCLMCIHT